MKTDTKSVRLPHQDFKQLQTPKALDLEKAVLGAILVDKAGIATLKTVFQRSDVFYHKAHQLIHKACISLDRRNVPIDLLVATQEVNEI